MKFMCLWFGLVKKRWRLGEHERWQEVDIPATLRVWQEDALAKFACAWVCVASMGCMCMWVGEQQPAGTMAQSAFA
jgi:hypothetical protein